jgi:hypothetical protein
MSDTMPKGSRNKGPLIVLNKVSETKAVYRKGHKTFFIIIDSTVISYIQPSLTFMGEARNPVLHLGTLAPDPILLYDNDYSLIIDIYFYETFSTLNQNK